MVLEAAVATSCLQDWKPLYKLLAFFISPPVGVTPDFSSAYVLDEWSDSWSQGKGYSFCSHVIREVPLDVCQALPDVLKDYSLLISGLKGTKRH